MFTFGYLFTWVKFQNYQFLERDYNKVARNKEYSQLWHLWKGANQIIFFTLIYFTFGKYITFVNIIFYWILFDGLLNRIVLNRPFFYIGQTAFIDKQFHKFSEWINSSWLNKITKRFIINPYILSGCLKIGLLLLSIRLLF